VTILIYETDDEGFAISAVEALQEAGIDSYKTGGRVSYGPSSRTVCVYIRDPKDFRRANQLLTEQGAVIDKPLPLQTERLAKLATFVGIALVTGIIVWVATL
jgi:hypothetical protein